MPAETDTIITLDYEEKDGSLESTKHKDGRVDLTIYYGNEDLTLWGLRKGDLQTIIDALTKLKGE
jgi:hypothetical protein